jgi:phosphoribosylformylglycinamidine synthase subunit PurQ / glutaminase
LTIQVGVVVFPGSNCEQDVIHALKLLRAKAEYIWHLEDDLSGFDALILPGGFAYGDYLRTGAMAAHSPVMKAVMDFADGGGPVIGICNGFQILCEAGILPGALRRNTGLKFRCMPVKIRVETVNSPFTRGTWAGELLNIPINHFEGNYYCSPECLAELDIERRVLFRYSDDEGEATDAANPNGAAANIAGILSEKRNVLGLMPHPERAVDPEVGGTDGSLIFTSMLSTLVT